MLVAIIAETNFENIREVIEQNNRYADAFELRLDFLSELNLKDLQDIREKIHKPIIFTLRSIEQGGYFRGSEEDRLACLYELAKMKPDYIDIESHVDNDIIIHLHRQYPPISIIRSYHNFNETPENLDDILTSMQHPDVSIYKIITYAKTSLDNFRVLHFVKNNIANITLVAHCMGPLGLPSRVIGAVVGNCFHYAATNNNPAPNCPRLTTMQETYHIKTLNQHTKIYALLGDPVEHSIGHIFHNKKYRDMGENAVYVKISLAKYQLAEFFKIIHDLPFRGFSVTMPLKEAIIPYIDSIDSAWQKVGAVNTVLLKNSKRYAINTDGAGACDAIEQQAAIANSRVLIIGAGGSARAIAFECRKRKASHLHIVTRRLAKAEIIAHELVGSADDFLSFPKENNYSMDIVINTIPNSEASDEKVFTLIKGIISSHTVILTIDYSQKSRLLLDKIKPIGCSIIGAKDMYENQALRQLAYWFG